MQELYIYITGSLAAKGLKMGLATIAMALSWLSGGMDEIAWALLAVIVLDYALGTIYAWKNGVYSARRFRDGLSKFMKYGAAVILGNLLDIILFHKSNVDWGWRNFIIVYLGVGEGISICKHLIKFNVNLPIGLIHKLENYREEVSGREIKPKIVPVNH